MAVTVSGLRWELPCGASTSANVCSVEAFTAKTTTLGGVGAPNNNAYNVYKLQVSSPPQTYFLNAGTSDIQRSWPLDYVRNVLVNAGATVTLSADAVDGAEIKNVDNTANGVPLIVPEVAPAPAAYNGQFIQMDVVAVTRAQ